MDFPLDPTLWGREDAYDRGGSRSDPEDEDEEDLSEFEQESGESEGSLYSNADDDADDNRGAGATTRDAEPNIGLNRLINSVFYGESRDALLDPVAPAGALGESWDKSIHDVLEDMENDNTTRSGRRKRTRRGGVLTLSPEVKSLLAQANAFFVQQDYKPAIDVLQEIIRIEPNTKPAYHTLSAIHTELGNTEKALQLDIVAAHISPREVDVWKDLGARSRQAGLLQQAIYCYTQGLAISRNDFDAIWDRAVLYKETNATRQAIAGFTSILKFNPHDPTTLRELIPTLIMATEIPEASKKLQEAFEYHLDKFPDGPSRQTLSLRDIIDLVDLLRAQRRFQEVISTCKIGQRWVQGRYAKGSAWDLFPDDREYDSERKARDDWQRNEQLRWLEDEPPYHLDFKLRTALGIARLMVNDKAEADLHLASVKEMDAAEHHDLIGEVADAYFEKRHYNTALELYSDLTDCELTNTPPVWIKIGDCNRQLGSLDAAIECYEAVIAEQPENMEARLQLAEVYEDTGNRDRALQLVNEVLMARREAELAQSLDTQSANNMEEDNIIERDAQSFFAESSRPAGSKPVKQKRTQAERDARKQAETSRQQDFENAYHRLAYLDHGLLSGDMDSTREWLDMASYLIDGFRETPELFPRDGKTKYQGIVSRSQKKRKAAGVRDTVTEAEELADRLARAMSADSNGDIVRPKADDARYSKTFCNITFDDWLILALRYAFVLTTNGEVEEADTVLRHLCTAANFRQSPEKLQALMFAIVACQIRAGNLDTACTDMRKICLRYNHLQTQGLRIIQAIFAHGQPESVAYSDNKLQKFNLRALKLIDGKALSGKDAPAKSKKKAKGASNTVVEEDEASDEEEVDSTDTFKPSKINPHFLAFYAHGLSMSRSYQSALYYYLRAYDTSPKDPLICLSAGLAYLHRGMQRQSDNRHHQIAQGFTLLSQYRNARGPCQEVEYNFGRAFHMLGIAGLACKHYLKVLEMEKADVTNSYPANRPGSYALYAAYNLHHLYASDGSPLAAKEISDKWLAF